VQVLVKQGLFNGLPLLMYLIARLCCRCCLAISMIERIYPAAAAVFCFVLNVKMCEIAQKKQVCVTVLIQLVVSVYKQMVVVRLL